MNMSSVVNVVNGWVYGGVVIVWVILCVELWVCPNFDILRMSNYKNKNKNFQSRKKGRKGFFENKDDRGYVLESNPIIV